VKLFNKGRHYLGFVSLLNLKLHYFRYCKG